MDSVDPTSSLERAKQLLTEGKELIAGGQKLLKIADRSEGGWRVAEEYMKDPVANDSDDEKCIKKAEKAVEGKLAKEKREKANVDSHFVGEEFLDNTATPFHLQEVQCQYQSSHKVQELWAYGEAHVSLVEQKATIGANVRTSQEQLAAPGGDQWDFQETLGPMPGNHEGSWPIVYNVYSPILEVGELDTETLIELKCTGAKSGIGYPRIQGRLKQHVQFWEKLQPSPFVMKTMRRILNPLL